jgi:hypothetical protein
MLEQYLMCQEAPDELAGYFYGVVTLAPTLALALLLELVLQLNRSIGF